MSISIITAHYNNLEGIKQTYECLQKQASSQWEWIIVDDLSDIVVKDSLQHFIRDIHSKQIQLIFNTTKTNGSVCRNIGIENASHSTLVFLDSDDKISEDFVTNRLIEVEEFVVFRNFNILNEKGDNFPVAKITANYLEHFLSAYFIWQTSSILWNKLFLIDIGKFNPDLQRLQDVELSIRALFLGTNYRVLDNKVDFFYTVSPIDIKKRPVKLISDCVNYLITSIHVNYNLSTHQNQLLKSYYYLCIKYLHRSKNREDVTYVRDSLKLFYAKKYITPHHYLIGLLLLKLYTLKLISENLFLKANRYFYKYKIVY